MKFLSKYRVIIAILIVVIIALAYYHFHNKHKNSLEKKPGGKPKPKKKVQATTNIDNAPVTDSPTQNAGAPVPPVTEGGQDAPDAAGILPSQNNGLGGLPQ